MSGYKNLGHKQSKKSLEPKDGHSLVMTAADYSKLAGAAEAKAKKLKNVDKSMSDAHRSMARDHRRMAKTLFENQ